MTRLKLLIPALIFLSASCNKAGEIVAALTESEAVEYIETSLQKNAGGLTTNLEDIAEELILAVNSAELCDTTYSKLIGNDFQGVQVQASYNTNFSYNLSCNAFDVPQSAVFTSETMSMYSSNRMDSDESGIFEGITEGLQPNSSTLNIFGNYSRTGIQELNFTEPKSISGTLSVNLSALTISKEDLAIQSGNGTFLLTGTATEQAFSYTGDIVFNGSNTAILTINDSVYELDWN